MERFSLGMVLLVVSAAAQGQPAGPSRPDPLDARADVPPALYPSPFAQYRSFAVQPPAPWRDVNDRVGRIGGWKVYAREALEAPDPSAAPADGSARSGTTPPPSGKPVPK